MWFILSLMFSTTTTTTTTTTMVPMTKWPPDVVHVLLDVLTPLHDLLNQHFNLHLSHLKVLSLTDLLLSQSLPCRCRFSWHEPPRTRDMVADPMISSPESSFLTLRVIFLCFQWWSYFVKHFLVPCMGSMSMSDLSIELLHAKPINITHAIWRSKNCI